MGKNGYRNAYFRDLTEKQYAYIESKHIFSLGIISECIKTVL